MHLASNADSEPVIDNEAGSPEENEEDNRVESEGASNPVLTDKIVEDSTTAVLNDVPEIVQETENEVAKESTQMLQNEEVASKVEVAEPVHEPLTFVEAVINSDVPDNAQENESEAAKESTQLLQKEEEVVSKAEVSEPTNKTSTYAEVVTNPLPVVTSELTFETENQTNDASVQKEDEDNENNGHIAENGALPTTEDKKEEESFFTCFSAFKFW